MDDHQLENKYKKRDDASAKLAEKMLQGWTLLGIHCPNENCCTPFVRSKQGKIFCVNCNQYAVTEEEFKAQQQVEQDAQRAKEIEKQQQVQANAQSNEQAISSNAIPAKRKVEEALSGAQEDSSLPCIKRKTIEALYHKIDTFNAELMATASSDRLVAIAQTIRELALAIQALESVQTAQTSK